MMRWLWPALTALFVLALSGPVAAQCQKDASPEKDADVQRLLELSGTAAMSAQIFTRTLETYRDSMPQVPDSVWDSVEAQTDPAGLVERLAPVYACHLSHEDIKAIIAFYETPAGQAYVEALPQLSQEAHAAGQRWAMELGQEVVQALREAGY